MFLPILGASIASALLFKLGAVSVWVVVMAFAIKVAVAAIVILAGMLGWKTINK